MIKKHILEKLNQLLEQKMQETQLSLEAAKESRDSETKSSVGDKYETGRTLMQMEVEKNRIQLKKTEKLKNELQQIDLHKKFDQVEFGSLVITTQNNYFISSALGKIEADNEMYFCISLASPIGQQLYKKRLNNTFIFQGKKIQILAIQ
uniref:hypothetical protein n=1 Tax=uncultured Draconibacterium sp. TaxID=1573823 RepID=UPI00321750FC